MSAFCVHVPCVFVCLTRKLSSFPYRSRRCFGSRDLVSSRDSPLYLVWLCSFIECILRRYFGCYAWLRSRIPREFLLIYVSVFWCLLSSGLFYRVSFFRSVIEIFLCCVCTFLWSILFILCCEWCDFSWWTSVDYLYLEICQIWPSVLNWPPISYSYR